jgi:hypothetical protein
VNPFSLILGFLVGALLAVSAIGIWLHEYTNIQPHDKERKH